MESINVCFSTSSGLISRAIRWFTRSVVSHALITFRDETLGQVFVMEANGRGFMLKPWSSWRQHNKLVARYELSATSAMQLASLRGLGSRLGAQYDYVGIVSFAVRRFIGRLHNPLAGASTMFCSEAVAKFLLDCGYTKFEDTESWTPGDILEELQKTPVIFKPVELA